MSADGTMPALVKYEAGDGHVEVREVPEPRCGEGQVKVAVAGTGICGTDLHVYHGTFRSYPPVIMGHEFAGTVAEVGAGVEAVEVEVVRGLVEQEDVEARQEDAGERDAGRLAAGEGRGGALGQLGAALGALDPQRETVVICHHGIRSRQVARYLDYQGFSNVINLDGGVEAWAREVDLDMPTY